MEEGVPGRPLVLVAEDDPDMRRLLAAVLTRDGYRVIEACNGVDLVGRIDAMAWSRGRDRLAAVVSDIDMPGC